MADAFPAPLAGDAAAVLADGRLYATTADAIQTAIDRMRALGSESFDSDAVRALQAKQGDVSHDIGRAWARYRNVGDSLVVYAGELQAAQDDANEAIRQYHAAAGEATTIGARLAEATQAAAQPGPEQAIHAVQAAQLSAAHEQLGAIQAAAQRRWQDAAARKALAAKNTAIAVHVASELGDLNDDFWDDLGDIVSVLGIVAAFAKTVLRVVATFLSILAAAASLMALIMPAFGGISAALFFGAQMVNLANAALGVVQDVLRGANVLDAVLVTMTVVASTVASMAAAAVTAGVAARVSESLGAAFGAQAGEAVGDVAGSLNDRVTDGLLGLGGSDTGDLYAHAAGEVRASANAGIGAGLGSAFGFGDRLAGGWVRDFHIGENPGAILPGGSVAGAGVSLTGADAASATGMGLFGETGSTGPLDSVARDAWKVAFPFTDGAALGQVASVVAPLDFRAGVGDVAQGVVHDFVGGSLIGQYVIGESAQPFLEAAARHAVGAETAGVTASGGWNSMGADAVRDTLGVSPDGWNGSDLFGQPGDFYKDRFERVTDGVDAAGSGLTADGFTDRFEHYLGFEETDKVDHGTPYRGREWDSSRVLADIDIVGIHRLPADGGPVSDLNAAPGFYEPIKVWFR